MNVEITFTDEVKELVEFDALEFYGKIENGRKITCMVQKQALEDYFGKSINEDFKSCFSRMKFFIGNLKPPPMEVVIVPFGLCPYSPLDSISRIFNLSLFTKNVFVVKCLNKYIDFLWFGYGQCRNDLGRVKTKIMLLKTRVGHKEH